MHLPAPKLLPLLALCLLSACDRAPAPDTSPRGTASATTGKPRATPRPAASAPAPAAHAAPVARAANQTGSAKTLDWEALIPSDWHPEKLIDKYDASNLADDDPKAKKMLAEIRRLLDNAPTVKTLDGQRVRLPGFVVPLEMDAKSIKEFLLVPYYGACVHVPPPPTNQTVYVLTPADKPYTGKLFDTVWVTGTMRIKKFDNDVGNAGYTLQASEVAPYE